MFASPAALGLLLALLIVRYSACAPTDDPEYCGNVTLSKNQICCQERVFNNPDGNLRCCIAINDDIKLYDPRKHYCFDGKIKNYSSTLVLPDLLQEKAKEKPNDPEYCGNVTLSKNQICCQERVFNNPDGNLRCCIAINDDIKLYDPRKHYCFDGKIKNYSSTLVLPDLLQENAKGKPSNVISCQGNIYPNMSPSDVECCGQQPYQKNDQHNPCKRFCGEKPYNSEYQMCCEDTIYNSTHSYMKCCKDALINTATHDCCNNRVSILKNGGLFCCKDLNVYLNATMTCDEQSGKIRLRPGVKIFDPSDLRTLEAGWKALTFDDLPGIVITGMVESSDIKRRRNILTIPLSPFSVTSNGLSVNLRGGEVFKIRVRFNKKYRDRVSDLKRSLKKKALVVHTKETSFLFMKKPELRIQRGDKSFVFLRKEKLGIVQE